MKTIALYKQVFVCLLAFVLTATAHAQTATIAGFVEGAPPTIREANTTIPVSADGSFRLERILDNSTILNLEIAGEIYEVFLEPGKIVELRIKDNRVQFSGPLTAENEHLLLDKELGVEIGQYFQANWVQLHAQSLVAYRRTIDSLKGRYLTNLEKASAGLSRTFVEVNTASIEFGFDRLILRYPQMHQRFTGEKVVLSPELLSEFVTRLNQPRFRTLESYQRFVRAYFNYMLAGSLASLNDTTVYHGQAQLRLALDLVSKTFSDSTLRESWLFEYIKAHIEQYTWVNGKQYLEVFNTECTVSAICEAARAYEQKQRADRSEHEVRIYKSAKGYQLEAHIFKPSDYDSTKVYPVLAAFHGGGWIAGHAAWTFESAQRAAQSGMVGVAFEYRLSNRIDISPLDALHDTRDAIIWLRENAKSLRIDPGKVVAKGLSAGGHLVSALSVLQGTNLIGANAAAIPNAIVLVSPAFDTQDDYFKSLLLSDLNPSAISPLEQLRPGLSMPQTLILQGRTDRLTPTTYVDQFKTRMDRLSYPCEVKIYEGCGHLFTPSHLDDTGWPQSDPAIVAQAFQEQDRFLRALGYIPAD